MSIFSGFDADNVEPSQPRTLIPTGDYSAVIEKVTEKENSKKNGSYLEFVFQIIAGPSENRKVFDLLNTKNPSRQAVDIANATMSAILRAVGVPRPVNEDEICNIPLVITVGVSTDKSGNPAFNGKQRNIITGYKALNEPQPAKVAAKVAEEAMARPAKAPWAKR